MTVDVEVELAGGIEATGCGGGGGGGGGCWICDMNVGITG
jgi:hypothetical protein